MTSSAATDSQPYLETLRQVRAAYQGNVQGQPAAKAVTEALLQAEITTKQQRLTFPLAALTGLWQLCFTAPQKARQKAGQMQGQGFYVPKFVPAYICFNPEEIDGNETGQGTIANQIQLGFVQLKLNGPFKYPGKKNLLGFDFTHAEFLLFGKALYNGHFQSGKATEGDFVHQPISKLPFFAFFLVTSDFIAARGRGGGLALWIRAD